VCPGRRKYRHDGRVSLYNLQTAGMQHSGSCGWTAQFDRVFDRITWSWVMCTDSHVCFKTERILSTTSCSMATVRCISEGVGRGTDKLPSLSAVPKLHTRFWRNFVCQTNTKFRRATFIGVIFQLSLPPGKQSPALNTLYTKLNVFQSYSGRSD
jgi:hypothetical protein